MSRIFHCCHDSLSIAPPALFVCSGLRIRSFILIARCLVILEVVWFEVLSDPVLMSLGVVVLAFSLFLHCET